MGQPINAENEKDREEESVKRLSLVLEQAKQQQYVMLTYQSQIFGQRPENANSFDGEAPKKCLWFDMCFGSQNFSPIKVMAPMCLKSRDPRRTDLEGNVTFHNFTGLMYAIIGNNTQVIEYLLPYEYMEVLQDDEQVLTKFGTFFLKEGATAYHLACCVADEENFKLIQNFYNKHPQFQFDIPPEIDEEKMASMPKEDQDRLRSKAEL